MDISDAVSIYRAFLVDGYESWRCSAELALARDRGYLDEAFYDWAQANWELLVERPVCNPGQFLQIYGAGSDYEAQLHSRVFFHEARPTHEVACQPVDGPELIDVLSGQSFEVGPCSLDRFVSRSGSWYEDQPPFDHVLLKGAAGQYLAPVAGLSFTLRPIA